ncbi:MAG: hypothetical protein RIS09_115 [Actinomycetota bacterium]
MLEMRARILEIVPDAQEVVSYGMPAFKVDGNTVAGLLANKSYVGYYPFSGSVLPNFQSELSNYVTTKSALHIPLGKPLSKTLLKKLIRARLSQCPVKKGLVDLKQYESKDLVWRELKLAAPARRALIDNKIFTLKDLSRFTENEVFRMHGIGSNALATLKVALKKHQLGFKKSK